MVRVPRGRLERRCGLVTLPQPRLQRSILLMAHNCGGGEPAGPHSVRAVCHCCDLTDGQNRHRYNAVRRGAYPALIPLRVPACRRAEPEPRPSARNSRVLSATG